MSKVLKVVAVIAAVVAIAVAVGPVIFGTAAFASALGVTGATAAATAASVASIAAIASAVSVVASIGAQLLTKPPPARGSVSQTIIAVDPPRPYVMGEGYCGGVRRYQRSYGGVVADVPNPYRLIVDAYCGHGPIDSISPRLDFAAVAGYYSGYLGTSTQLGACPETSALALTWAGAPGWTASAKLSGIAAIGWNMKFDKEGKRFASGTPVLGAYGKWVKVYDPRLDSTFPGGSGAHRIGTESTYTWSENPALHFAQYAFGRYQNGKKVMGVGLPSEGIDWPIIAAWANVCDANGWKIFGRLFEPGDRWANLKDIALAGGGVPVFSAALLSVMFSAPRISLGTITSADLAEGDCSTTKMQPYASRINTIVPKYTDANSNWEQMAAGPISFAGLVTADGGERRQEFPFNFVKSVNQAAQLAAYKILDSREETPIELLLLPQWRFVRPGECYTLNLPELGISGDAILIKREIDPAIFGVKLTFIGETASKHAAALAMTGTAPPSNSGTMTGEARDVMGAWGGNPAGGLVYEGGLVV